MADANDKQQDSDNLQETTDAPSPRATLRSLVTSPYALEYANRRMLAAANSQGLTNSRKIKRQPKPLVQAWRAQKQELKGLNAASDFLATRGSLEYAPPAGSQDTYRVGLLSTIPKVCKPLMLVME